MMDVTVHVGVDKTNFETLKQNLYSFGMEIKHISEELGIVKGIIPKTHFSSLVQRDDVSFVTPGEKNEDGRETRSKWNGFRADFWD